jgi:GTPase SAR1 family protein
MAAVLPPPPRATSVLVIGMAGSGKSTFAAALARTRQRDALDAAQSSAQGSADAAAAAAAAATPDTRPTPAYLVNLDPAVTTLGYEPNVDIRDTVDYRRVMEE